MKDNIISAIRILIGLGLGSYAVWLWMQGLNITAPGYESYNMAFLVIIILMSAGMLVVGILRVCPNRPKLTQFLLGIVLILVGHYLMQDNAGAHIYMADILKLLGAMNAVLGPTGICILDKCKKKAQEKKTVIIEV